MFEAWWRSLKHQWLFLHSLDSVTTVRRLVAYYVEQHNRVLPHSAFHGQTPDEIYFRAGDTVPQTCCHARPPRAAHVFKPTDRRRARYALQQYSGARLWCVDRLSDRTVTGLHILGRSSGKTGNRTRHE